MQNLNQPSQTLSNLSNWKTLAQIAKENPQFSHSQLKRLFWKRDEHQGLNTCVKKIGKRIYINEPAFALWMAGEERTL